MIDINAPSIQAAIQARVKALRHEKAVEAAVEIEAHAQAIVASDDGIYAIGTRTSAAKDPTPRITRKSVAPVNCILEMTGKDPTSIKPGSIMQDAYLIVAHAFHSKGVSRISRRTLSDTLKGSKDSAWDFSVGTRYSGAISGLVRDGLLRAVA